MHVKGTEADGVVDVSTSFKRLQAEKLAADKILQELTPLQSVQEVESLRDYLQNMTLKTEVRLNCPLSCIDPNFLSLFRWPRTRSSA